MKFMRPTEQKLNSEVSALLFFGVFLAVMVLISSFRVSHKRKLISLDSIRNNIITSLSFLMEMKRDKSTKFYVVLSLVLVVIPHYLDSEKKVLIFIEIRVSDSLYTCLL